MPVVMTAKTNRPSAARSRSATAFQRSGDAGVVETKATASASVIMPLLNCPSQWRCDPKVAAKLAGLKPRLHNIPRAFPHGPMDPMDPVASVDLGYDCGLEISMRLRLIALIAVAVLTLGWGVHAGTPFADQVKVEGGTIKGAVADGVLSFKGIPFAAPPQGDLRWRPPQPVVAWTGVRPATEYGHDCMQKPFGGDAAPLGTEPAEDCLVVNVW